jgi:hypothetical protein
MFNRCPSCSTPSPFTSRSQCCPLSMAAFKYVFNVGHLNFDTTLPPGWSVPYRIYPGVTDIFLALWTFAWNTLYTRDLPCSVDSLQPVPIGQPFFSHILFIHPLITIYIFSPKKVWSCTTETTCFLVFTARTRPQKLPKSCIFTILRPETPATLFLSFLIRTPGRGRCAFGA